MKWTSFLLLATGLLLARAAVETGQAVPGEGGARALSQIRVEEEAVAKTPKKTRIKKQPMQLKPEVRFFRKMDSLIEKYGLDKELDQRKLNGYFKGLGKRVYRQLRERMARPAKLEQPYRDSVAEFKRVAQKYGIK
jgi:hypothetical protein